MCPRGSRGAYRKEERAKLPKELQKRLVESAAVRFGTLERLAKKLEVPKSSVHYYRVGRITMPISIMEKMLAFADDPQLEQEVRDAAIMKDRTWANSYAAGIHREMCRERVHLPTREELDKDDDLRRKAAAIISYVMAEGSIWIKHNRFDAPLVNITFAEHETDLYEHFRSLCNDVFDYDIGTPQKPGNNARAIRGFICSRFVAEWLISEGIPIGEKSSVDMHLPEWVIQSGDRRTLVSSLQPWCDGEGSVIGRIDPVGFSISQSRHTTLSDDDIIYNLAKGRHRYIGKSALSSMELGEVNVLDHCRTRFRSSIVDDLAKLCRMLEIDSLADVSRLAMKDDGFWSCIWSLRFGKVDACSLYRIGAITQRKKKACFENQYLHYYNNREISEDWI